MKKYLVFKKSSDSKKSNFLGGFEEVACDIAIVVGRRTNSQDKCIAFLADSPEATLALMQSSPLCSIELDQTRINSWINDAKPLFQTIENFGYVINDARGFLTRALCEIEECAKSSVLFKNVDLIDDISIGSVFDEMGKPNEHNFMEHLKKEFNVQIFEKQSVWSP